MAQSGNQLHKHLNLLGSQRLIKKDFGILELMPTSSEDGITFFESSGNERNIQHVAAWLLKWETNKSVLSHRRIPNGKIKAIRLAQRVFKILYHLEATNQNNKTPRGR